MPCHISRDVFYPEVVHAHIWNFALSLVLYFTAKHFLWFNTKKNDGFSGESFLPSIGPPFLSNVTAATFLLRGYCITCHGV